MITYNEKWHYLVVKRLSALFRGITSNHIGNAYYLNCLHSFRTENEFKKNGNLCKKNDYFYLKMSEKSLKYNHSEKSLKTPFIIYADL